MANLVIPYRPREIFLPYHASDKRFSLTVAHRRAGKTVARVNKLIRKAVECDKHNPRFGYLAPYYVQAKDIAWIYLKHYCGPLLQLGGKANESELSVTLPHNNGIIKLYGAENAERMRGLYFDGIVIDEGQGINKTVLTQIIMPALADRLGWLDVSGTPKGWENLLGELAKMAKNNPEWFFQILKASKTNIIPKEELARQKALMPDNEYDQEFECSFDAAITGSVYGQWLAGKELLKGLYDPELPVHTAWDLGFDDATSIWFWQIVKNEIRLIDYYENNGQDIEHYCDFLKSRKYNYGKHYVPHDAAYKLLAAGGRSIVQQAYAYGVKMFVVAATSQQNSIEAARKTAEISYFDEKAEQGFTALKQYQFEYDDDKKTFRSKPRHDWTSHAADAYEIIGQVWRNPVISEEEEKPRFLSDLTAKEVFWPENNGKRREDRF
jgi:phage terminase large subunit